MDSGELTGGVAGEACVAGSVAVATGVPSGPTPPTGGIVAGSQVSTGADTGGVDADPLSLDPEGEDAVSGGTVPEESEGNEVVPDDGALVGTSPADDDDGSVTGVEVVPPSGTGAPVEEGAAGGEDVGSALPAGVGSLADWPTEPLGSLDAIGPVDPAVVGSDGTDGDEGPDWLAGGVSVEPVTGGVGEIGVLPPLVGFVPATPGPFSSLATWVVIASSSSTQTSISLMMRLPSLFVASAATTAGPGRPKTGMAL